jgi:type II secretory ATPase GspE/PulE/Tfp pilus assembly ATPase PilB-like protein
VVTGSPHSGRSTTLEAVATDAAAAGRSVIAVVDHIPPPLRFVVGVVASAPGVWDAIEAQGADVVTIDELGDAETGRRAIRLAMSGTTVVASVVASDVARVVARLIALGIDGFALSSALTAVLLQRRDHAVGTTGHDAEVPAGTTTAFELFEPSEVLCPAGGAA